MGVEGDNFARNPAHTSEMSIIDGIFCGRKTLGKVENIENTRGILS